MAEAEATGVSAPSSGTAPEAVRSGPGCDECLQLVVEACGLENEAIELDRRGEIDAAVQKYDACIQKLVASVAKAFPAHAADEPRIRRHMEEVQRRVGYLQGLGGEAPAVPVEEHIKAVQLDMQSPAPAGKEGPSPTLAACAALGAAGGFVVMGPFVGIPLAVVGGGAAGALAATRKGRLGDGARAAGGVAASGVERVRRLNEEHGITAKVRDSAIGAADRAKQVNNKYRISDRVAQGVGTAVGTARSLDERHQVSGKVSSGVSSGLKKAGGFFSAASQRGSAMAANAAPLLSGAASAARDAASTAASAAREAANNSRATAQPPASQAAGS